MHTLYYISIRKIVNQALLFLSYGLSVFTKRCIVWGLPSSFSLEPTNFCNLDCKECPTNKVNTPKGMLDFETAKTVINKLSPTAFHASLFFQGEPFMHNQLADIIQYAHQKHIATTVSTNGHYITPQMATAIVQSKAWRIIVSIDGYDQASYATYRSGGSFETVLQSITILAQAKKEQNAKYPIIEAQCLLLSSTENHLSRISQIALQAGANRIRFKSAQMYEYQSGNPLMPKQQASRYKLLPDGRYQIKSRLPNRCWRLWHTVVVNWQGSALVCCFDKDWQHQIASLQTQSINTIWKHPSFMQFRQSVLQKRAAIDICKNCTSGLRL